MTTTNVTQNEIQSTGWQPFLGTMPTSPSTTDGVDTLTLTDADDFLSKGAKVKITSGAGTHMYYVSDATSTNFKVNGETSVTGTITAMWYSYADCPFEFKPMYYYNLESSLASAQSIPSSTVTTLQLTADVDESSAFTASYEYEVQITGQYCFFAQEFWSSAGVDRRWSHRLRVSVGSDEFSWATHCSGGSVDGESNTTSAKKTYHRGDKIYMTAYQGNTISEDVVADFDVQFVGV